MKNHGALTLQPPNQILVQPAYPFDGVHLFNDVRTRLSKAFGYKLGLRELARMMARSTSTTHFWLSAYSHPQVVGLVTLLEYLSSQERRTFIESYCRLLPTIADLRMSGPRRPLEDLLAKQNGLTLLTGSENAARSFVLSAIGHSWCRSTRLDPAGIDIYSPHRWVPITGIRYIDENLQVDRIRALVQSVWPKVVTSSAKLVVFNGLLRILPEVFNDMLKMAAKQHVILAESVLPDVSSHRVALPANVHLLSVASCQDFSRGMRVKCRRTTKIQGVGSRMISSESSTTWRA